MASTDKPGDAPHVSGGVPGDAPGGEQRGPTAEEIAAGRERAMRMLEGMKPEERKEMAEGMKDLQNTMVASALPAVRTLFHHMLTASDLRGGAKARAAQKIAEFSPITEAVCLKIDFYDRLAGRARTAYMLLAQCPKEHNLGAQLEKVKTRIVPEKWPQILQHLSMLVFTARSLYAQIATHNQALLQEMVGERQKEYSTVKIDNANTTIYLNAGWPNRIGILVRLDDEVGAADEASGAGGATADGDATK
jgi:hypothetical protein